jgi:hypothetical protein
MDQGKGQNRGCPKPQGQRVSISMQGQDFREEVGIQHATDHLSAEAVFDRVTLQKRDGKASQPT